ncbi:MAG: phosphoribosylamine--glycine ligase [Prevotellaceae bacterium]|jgi:phosphoribosylamine--glycine ligase|nr:phosphoribosylamine--glycine ligase [Prevotellaceae bacterium]
MNVLLLGSGGREHAFAEKIAKSHLLDKLFIAPGNPGTAECGQNISLDLSDFAAIEKFVVENNVEMLVVGPEDPLVKGIADYFDGKPVSVIGPSKKGAALEGSKDFAKDFMLRHGIPTARYKSFDKDSLQPGYDFLEQLSPPFVLKADGLAAGKGVIIVDSLPEAKSTLKEMLDGKFGAASSKVVIEEFLRGIELSVFVLTDGKSYKILPEAKDYKRIGNGDKGLNTGGMGAVSPVPFANKAFMKKVEENIVKPTIEGLQKDGISYKGFIFLGLMNCDGEPYLIEYNVRMGDPETETVLPRLEADILDLFKGVADGTLDTKYCSVYYHQTAVTVVIVSGGYPGEYKKGFEIEGLDLIKKNKAYHAGTSQEGDKILTSGGRVIAMTALSYDLPSAIKWVYNSIYRIKFEGSYYREDIGKDLISNEQ